MSTRRRVGASAATSEAARRQLMEPVSCAWEKQWSVIPNTTVKVLKWAKLGKKAENLEPIDVEDDAPLDAPLLELADNEVEMIEDDEEGVPMSAPTPAPTAPMEGTETPQEVEERKPTELVNPGTQPTTPGGFDTSDFAGVDLGSLGPDGIPFEGAGNLTQMEEEDALLGGVAMDESQATFGEELTKP